MDTGSVRGVLAGLWIAASVGAVGLATPAAQADGEDALTAEIRAADAAMFAAFNTCDQPGQLDKYIAFYAPDVEFYHDNGGLQLGRDTQVELTRKNVCGHFSRELLPGTLQVYPIKDFGAVSRGSHRFCQFDTGQCGGEADFLIIWKRVPSASATAGWQVTRVVSYGHHAIAPVAPAAGTPMSKPAAPAPTPKIEHQE